MEDLDDEEELFSLAERGGFSTLQEIERTNPKNVSYNKRIDIFVAESLRDSFHMTPLHHAVLGNHEKVVKILLDWKFFQSHVNAYDIFKRTALQIACTDNTRVSLVRMLLAFSRTDANITDCCGFNPLHWAVHVGATEVVRVLASEEGRKANIRTTIKSDDGQHPHKLAEKLDLLKKKDIQDLLVCIPEVKDVVERLYIDRQVYVDAANAILVGAALISIVTSGRWLQPPLHDNDDSILPLLVFWGFSSLSFYLAMGSVIAGAAAVLPLADVYIEDAVEELRKWLVATTSMLIFSILFVLGAFAAAEFASLSQANHVKSGMKCTLASTSIIGSAICGTCCILFLQRLLRVRPLQLWEKLNKPPKADTRFYNSKRLGDLFRACRSKSHATPDSSPLFVFLCVAREQKLGFITDVIKPMQLCKQGQTCRIRCCYKALDSKSGVRLPARKLFLPANTAMWEGMFENVNAVFAAGPGDHVLVKDYNGKVTLPSRTENEVAVPTGLESFRIVRADKSGDSYGKLWGNVSQRTAKDPSEDHRELRSGNQPSFPESGVNLPPGMTQLNKSVWQLYCNPNAVEVDIIFVHGIQREDFEDSEDYKEAFLKTWSSIKGTECWPAAWLSQVFPKARILSVSYNPGICDIDVYDVAEVLVCDIVQDLDHDIGQLAPVFLVGHCLGGIVIKQFLNSVSIACTIFPENDRLHTFLENLKGVVFFATPHHGMRKADRLSARSPILGLLKFPNYRTETINKVFSACRQKWHIAAMAIAESLPTKVSAKLKYLLVSEASARSDVDLFYNVAGDHFTVCRAHRRHSQIIELLTQFIVNLSPQITRYTF